MDKNTISVALDGRLISFKTGQVARQANGSVILLSGETMILASACASPKPLDGINFLPLKVDHQEKFSSTGKTLGGYIKREGRPTEREILTSRLIDRPLRPLFPEGYYHEVQLLSYVLSYDGIHQPDPLAICACSAALCISDIPLTKPVGAVQVGLIDGRFVINPTYDELKKSKLDLVLAGTEEALVMIEGHCHFLPEEVVLEAIEEGFNAVRLICQTLQDWQNMIGKPKATSTIRPSSNDLLTQIEESSLASLKQVLHLKGKLEKQEELHKISEELLTTFCSGEQPIYAPSEVLSAFKEVQSRLMREMILSENCRNDGRTTTEIRPITIDLDFLPRTHGSALFTRGETQSLAVATLGGETMAQRFETLHGEGANRFYLQYFFPPFSVGEVGRAGPPGRREIGHGKLAERALQTTLPPIEEFPYVVRVESNITESNGSSSMASVCGATLAMMNAGIPLKAPIAGIAMGLILEKERYAILSDISGIEDGLGDMDFKVAGSEQGVTAFQLDIKVEGITHQIMQESFRQAKEGRLHILKKMKESCPQSKETLSPHAPRIETVRVKPSKIGVVIGPGGKQIRALVEETGAEINIDDTGLISITATTQSSMEKAKSMIHDLTAELEVDGVYTGKIVSIVAFGLFVAIYGQEGLCHISEIDHERIEDIKQAGFKEGQEIQVKVLEIDQKGKIRLSRKVLLPKPTKVER